MEQIIKLLEEIKMGIDYSNEDGLVTKGILDSIDVTSLIASLEACFNIEIGMEYLENSNFDSVEAIYHMVEELIDD